MPSTRTAPPLARALFRAVDLNEAVPAKMYVAVAQVLIYGTQKFAIRVQADPEAIYRAMANLRPRPTRPAASTPRAGPG